VPTSADPPPIAIAQYDPHTGTYLGPDGRQYTQTDLTRDANQHQSWQDMLLPPKGQ
jgi:phospholipid/cholesterol/gamma-HCH transport system substrate-binding protein